MSFGDLSKVEQDVIYQCLKAAVEGSFFPEWEFHTFTGSNLDEGLNLISNNIIDR